MVYILMLNWNGWSDTQRCLESLFRQSGQGFRVLLLDNGSADDSVAHILSWAQGNELVSCDEVPSGLRPLIHPPCGKPVDASSICGQGGDIGDLPNTRLLLISRKDNLGFAGGMNVLLRLALAQEDCAAVWLLNNDVLLDKNAFDAMQGALAGDELDRPIGAMIYDYDEPHALQACGGQRIGKFGVVAPRHAKRIEMIDFLLGASLFMSADRARQLGEFDHRYFLNAEDLIYSYFYAHDFRATHMGQLPFLVAGRIWHDESSSQRRDRSRHTYYFTRNIVHAAWRIQRLRGIATGMYAVLRAGKAVLFGRVAVAAAIIRGVIHAMLGKLGPLNERV